MPWTFPRPSVKALAIGAATLVVAWLAGWAALGLAFADRAPAIAASSPVGAGPATGKWARLLVALTIDPRLTDPSAIFPKKMPARSVALARKAFSVEPMSADALVVLAMAANANGDAVPPDTSTLSEIATRSGGQASTAEQADELSAVYKKLGSEVAEKLQKREVTSAFAGGAALFLLLGGGLSLRWFRRLL
jgi:hypothetical protein